jgi:hypothetical protein
LPFWETQRSAICALLRASRGAVTHDRVGMREFVYCACPNEASRYLTSEL